MRLALLVAVAIIAWAAFISVAASFEPPNYLQFGASTILIVAIAIQRINGVQRWLASPKNRRKQQVEVFAQQALLNLCDGKQVNSELLELSVHVWEVPLWYRRLFPFRFRDLLKRLVRRRGFQFIARLQIRPTLKRVVAVGLVKQVPSGVRFRKRVGLVGVCIANNDRSEVLRLRVADATYRDALKLTSENEWRLLDAQITHNLELRDAQTLARVYGQVIARVIVDPETGEAIGCATISSRSGGAQALRLTTNTEFRRYLLDLANFSADSLT